MENKTQDTASDRWQREQWTVLTTSAMVLAGVALAYMLWFTRSAMIPFVLGLFVVAVVAPISDLLETRARFPRWLSMLVVLLVVLIATLGFLLLLSYTAQEIYRSADRYVQNFDDLQHEILDKSKERLSGTVDDRLADPHASGDLGVDLPDGGAISVTAKPIPPTESSRATEPSRATESSRTKAESWATDDSDTGPADSEKSSKNLFHKLLDSDRMEEAWQQLMEELKSVLIRFLKGTIGSAVGLFSTFTFMFIFVLFLLAGRDPAKIVGSVYAGSRK